MSLSRFGRFKGLLLSAMCLLFMATSCPMQYDPFEELAPKLGSLGFYVDGTPIIYEVGSTSVHKVSGVDSLMIRSEFILDHYRELIIKFSREDLVLETPILNPEIELTYLYSVDLQKPDSSADRYEYRTFKADNAKLSFSHIGYSEELETYILSGTFEFQGKREYLTGASETISATGGVFTLEVSSGLLR